jgi:predicted PurR-regulated permease PerM
LTFGQWLGLLALVAALLLLWSLRETLILVFAAIVLAMALCTLVGMVRRRLGCARPLAVLLSLLLVVLVVAVVGTAVIPPFVEQFSELISKLPAAATALLDLVRGWLQSASQMLYGGQAADLGWLRDGLFRVGEPPNLGGGALRLLGVALMVTIQPPHYRDVAILLVPSFYRRRFAAVLSQCGEALSAWMVGVLISSLAVGSLAAIGLSLLGVKLVAANAVLSGVLNVIPNVGPTLSTVFPMSVALLESPWKSLAVLLLYVVVQNLESYLITPSVMHHQLKLLPGLTLTAQLLFTLVFGPLGLLLALPLAVCVQVIVREVVIHDLLDPWKRRRSSL